MWWECLYSTSCRSDEPHRGCRTETPCHTITLSLSHCHVITLYQCHSLMSSNLSHVVIDSDLWQSLCDKMVSVLFHRECNMNLMWGAKHYCVITFSLPVVSMTARARLCHVAYPAVQPIQCMHEACFVFVFTFYDQCQSKSIPGETLNSFGTILHAWSWEKKIASQPGPLLLY